MPPPFTTRYILDESKRRQIIALIANGSSRRVAARYVGCAGTTITRTATRDPEFAAQLAHAEHIAEINLLRSIQKAGQIPKHWRAAAWLLERSNPEDFVLRQPDLVTEEQMATSLTQIAEALAEDLPEENYRRAMRKLETIVLEMKALRDSYNFTPIADETDETPAAPNAPALDMSLLEEQSEGPYLTNAALPQRH